jgi:hypothetical protein
MIAKVPIERAVIADEREILALQKLAYQGKAIL